MSKQFSASIGGVPFLLPIALLFTGCTASLGPEGITTARARKALRQVMERSGECENIRFDDKQGQRAVLFFSRQNQRECGIGLPSVLTSTVRAIYHSPSPDLLPCWRVIWADYAFPKEQFIYSDRWSRSNAQSFVRALKFLAAEAQREADSLDVTYFEHFKEEARAWRELPTKPAMPEEARRHMVVAEDALREKKLDKALQEYDAALRAFPCWPQGHFKCALMAGENRCYRFAVLHMKCYLELAPDAPDARAARDKIYLWQDQIKAP